MIVRCCGCEQMPVVVLGGMLMGVGLFLICYLTHHPVVCPRAHDHMRKEGVLPLSSSQAKQRAQQINGKKHGRHTRLSTREDDSD